MSARRSERFLAREQRELRRELLISPYPELGLVAMDGPERPRAGSRWSRKGGSSRWTAAAPRTSTSSTASSRANGLDLEVATEAAALGDDAIARRPGRRRRAACRARATLARPDARAPRARRLEARPGRADVRAEEAARPAGSGQPGPRDEPEGEPGAARRRRRRGRRARVRRGGDDGGRLALRAAERDRHPRRLADRTPGRDDAVRGRGAAQPPARDPGARHLRGDAVGVRDGAGVRRRRRHAVVEGVPRLGLRLPRRQGAVHLGRRLGGADGPRAGLLDALPRGPLPGRDPRRRLAGRAERVDLVRGARAVGAGRRARDPRRERARRLARPRGRLRERRDRVALARSARPRS